MGEDGTRQASNGKGPVNRTPKLMQTTYVLAEVHQALFITYDDTAHIVLCELGSQLF